MSLNYNCVPSCYYVGQSRSVIRSSDSSYPYWNLKHNTLRKIDLIRSLRQSSEAFQNRLAYELNLIGSLSSEGKKQPKIHPGNFYDLIEAGVSENLEVQLNSNKFQMSSVLVRVGKILSVTGFIFLVMAALAIYDIGFLSSKDSFIIGSCLLGCGLGIYVYRRRKLKAFEAIWKRVSEELRVGIEEVRLFQDAIKKDYEWYFTLSYPDGKETRSYLIYLLKDEDGKWREHYAYFNTEAALNNRIKQFAHHKPLSLRAKTTK